MPPYTEDAVIDDSKEDTREAIACKQFTGSVIAVTPSRIRKPRGEERERGRKSPIKKRPFTVPVTVTPGQG